MKDIDSYKKEVSRLKRENKLLKEQLKCLKSQLSGSDFEIDVHIDGQGGDGVSIPSIDVHEDVGRPELFDDAVKSQIVACRASGATYQEIATKFNCSIGLVYKIINSKN